jgi:hypothetical protein
MVDQPSDRNPDTNEISDIRPPLETVTPKETTIKEREIPPDAKALIDSFNLYNSYKKFFQEYDKQDKVIDKTLQEPWNKVYEKINKAKEKVNMVIEKSGKYDSAEELGLALYTARSKYEQTPPKGKVKAFCKGAAIVMVVDNEDDLRKACNLEEEKNIEHSGVFQRNTVYRMGNDWNDTITEVPTIVVVDRGEETEKNINHEKNHQYAEMYFTDKNIDWKLSILSAANALGEFSEGKNNPDFLLNALRDCSRQLRTCAIEEMTVEMLASHHMDWRDAYTDEYFQPLTNMDLSGKKAEALPYISQVKEEFKAEMRKLQSAIAKAIQSFGIIEKDKEIIYGSVAMSILSAKTEALGPVIDNMDFITKIATGEESYYLRQDLEGLQHEAVISHDPDRYDALEELKRQLLIDSKDARTNEAYGYINDRKEGKDFTTAISKASLRRDEFIRKAKIIDTGKQKLADEIHTHEKLNHVKNAIEQAKDSDPVENNEAPKPTTLESETDKPKGNILTRFRRFFKKSD